MKSISTRSPSRATWRLSTMPRAGMLTPRVCTVKPLSPRNAYWVTSIL